MKSFDRKDITMEKWMSYEEFSYRIGEPITDEYGKSPITPVFSLFQGKWKLHVIYALFCLSDTHFNSILRFCDPITPASLNAVLKDLIASGIVEKRQAKGDRHAAYSLTQKGMDLQPCFYEMMNWGFSYRVSKRKGK